MPELVKAVLDAPLPQVLVVAGIVFCALAIVGHISGKVDLDKNGRIASGGLGGVLLAGGLVLAATGIPQRGGTGTTPTVSGTNLALKDLFTPTPAPPTPVSPTPVPPTLTPVPVAQPSTCVAASTVSGPIGRVWGGDPGVKDALGCPTSAAFPFDGVEQSFEHGHMVYRVETRRITVLFADVNPGKEDFGTWAEYTDTYTEDAEGDIPYVGAPPPANELLPVRGFGKIWRQDPARVQNKLSFATGVELGFQGTLQTFENGRMLLTGLGNPPSPTVWMLTNTGGYRRFASQ